MSDDGANGTLPPRLSSAFSVLILTLNEERSLPRCLASLEVVDDVHVLDSGSTDTTRELAQTWGAHVAVRRQEGRFLATEQRNWALANLDLAHEWVLFLDADEVATPEFLAAVERAVTGASEEVSGFWAAPRFLYQGTWLRRYMGFPNWHPRVIRRTARVGGGLWEDFAPDVRTEKLSEPYLHFANDRGFEDWVSRHLRYAVQDAEMAKSTFEGGEKKAIRRRLARGAGPLRPLLMVAYNLVVRAGVADRGSVYSYARRHLIYELMIQEAVREARREEKGLPR